MSRPRIGRAWFNAFCLEVYEPDAMECSEPGRDAAPYVARLTRSDYVSDQLDAIDPADIRAELRECGAWDDAELADDMENRERLVWLAACDICDQDDQDDEVQA